MNLQQKTINTIRGLALDQIAEANSGHPGIALGAAPIVFSVYNNMAYNPSDPHAPCRDRFVLSAGHGSSMLYATLALLTNKIDYKNLNAFRKLGSNLPGHPDINTPFVEASTGPLGQGVAMAVGMAIAEKKVCVPGATGNFTFCLAGDGCLMEGVALEALDLAVTLNLNKFILLYDYNNTTIEGEVALAQVQNPKAVFKAKGFNVVCVNNGNNASAINKAIVKCKNSNRPSVIICKTQIGFGSNRAGCSNCHGTPFSKNEVKLIKQNLGLSTQEFFVDTDVLEYAKTLKDEALARYRVREQENRNINYKRPVFLQGDLELNLNKTMSTRDAGGMVLNALAENNPSYFLGGSADLAPSTRQFVTTQKFVSANDFSGCNIHYGVREHAMAAISNGISLYGSHRAFASTFFSFFDYLKPALRMSALMKQNVIYVFTSDSVYAGEDGPTHQPVEQLVSIRAMPNVCDFRPCDAEETKHCYLKAIELDVPSVLILTRQKVEALNISGKGEVENGAYVAFNPKNKIEAIIVTSGSEVALSIKAARAMDEKGFGVRVVNVVSCYLFNRLGEAKQAQILPSDITNRIIVEAASELALSKYVGIGAKNVCVNKFGASGKGDEVYTAYGFTPQNIAKQFNITL